MVGSGHTAAGAGTHHEDESALPNQRGCRQEVRDVCGVLRGRPSEISPRRSAASPLPAEADCVAVVPALRKEGKEGLLPAPRLHFRHTTVTLSV